MATGTPLLRLRSSRSNLGFLAMEFSDWESGVGTTFQTLMAPLSTADRTCRNGSGAMLALSDQLNASARTAAQWLAANVCPISDIDDRMTRTLRSYRNLAETIETEAKYPVGPDLKELDREIMSLIGMFAQTLALMSDRANP